MATYTPTDYSINQVTIGGLPFALLNVSIPASVALNDVLEFSNTLGVEINTAFLSAGIISVFGVESADISRWNNLEYATTAIRGLSLSLTDTVTLVENSNRAYRRTYRLLKNNTQVCDCSSQQGASGDSMSGCYGVILRVNNQYCGYSGTLGSVYDRYGAQYTNPFGNTTKDGVLIGLPSPEKLYTATQWVTITAVNLDMSSDIVVESGEPYEDIEPSGTAGGDGTYIFQDSDDIDFPSLPNLAAVNTGFVSLWSPTEEQMLDLSSYMWNANPLTIDFWKKLVADPKDLIFGLSLVPLNLEELGYIDGQGSVVVGLINTGIVMDKVSSQWIEFDCGSLDIEEAWGAYLDYDPYTKLEIYLPFCGVHPIRVDDFTPGSVSLKYYIDLLSGTCVAMVKSTKSDKHSDVLNSVMYQFMGNCAAQIPVSSQQFADAVRSAISIAASIGTMVATGVGGAAAMTAASSAGAGVSIGMRTASSQLSSAASAVENVMNLKPAIERSGAIGSTAALLSVRRPYLILTRPRMARPDKQSAYTGYPSFITETLGDVTGWTIVQAIHLEAIPCTSEEMSEIDELLKGGVIF